MICFPFKTWNKVRISVLTTVIVLAILFRAIRQETEIKDIEIENEDIQLSLCADEMIVYIENFKDSTKELELRKFKKVTDYKRKIKYNFYRLAINT